MQRRSKHRAAPVLRRWLAPVVGFALASVAIVAVAGGDAGVLGLVPALLIAMLLSKRRYPGARLLVAMRSRAAIAARRRGLAPIGAAVRVLAVAPRGGLLLARSLANRPPPVLLLAR